MFDPAAQLEAAVTARARKGARRAGLLILSGLLLATGAGFLTVAIWIVASTAWSPQAAALMLGVIYLGLGGIVIAIASTPQRDQSHVTDQTAAHGVKSGTANPYPPLAEAFVFGLDTALRLRRGRDR
ncbi:MAG: phage holin family protein [Paracoccaceae bacterium]|uniref:phage holin family protein n=1 Tax=unclassified Seohaeicola TaxID=2641111 RepID=UPI00237A2D4C|nr:MULTISPECIES: phage holin family protein [unclassified Seohaeicola]MDD9705751.1 phage holin family protein [Seohaeicola sp. 4SK31]MDD9735262.1 phage holin family protein [Seohaeicola sp. SP36]